MSYFFFLLLWNSKFLYESTVVTLPIQYDNFWYAVAFTEQRCPFDKCGFLRTQYCGHKRIKIVFYWIAGVVYWSAVSFTNPLVTITGRLLSSTNPGCSLLSSTNPGCSLLIRGGINKSAGVNYWCAKKKLKCSKHTQKRSKARKKNLLVHLGTMTELFMKKKISLFTSL